MAKITLKGREIPLVYTVYEMKLLQEEIAPLGDLQYILFGRNRENDDDTSLYGTPEHLQAVARLIRILGNGGLEEAGQEANLTDKWVMRALKPWQITEGMGACMEAMNEGMASEIPDVKKESGAPVDVTLEQMNKKKEKEG